MKKIFLFILLGLLMFACEKNPNKIPNTNLNIVEYSISNTTPDKPDSIPYTNPNTPDTIPDANPDTTTNNDVNNMYKDNIYLNNQLNNIIKLEVFRNNVLSTFNLPHNDTIYFTTIEYYMFEGEKYNRFPGDVAYDDYIGSIDSINVFYNDKKYTYINKPYEQGDLEYFFRKHIYTIVIDEEKKNALGWE